MSIDGIPFAAGGRPLLALAYEHLDIGSGSSPLSPSVYDAAGQQEPKCAVVFVSDGSIRYRADGTDPTSTTGIPIGIDGSFAVWGSRDIQRIQFTLKTPGKPASIDVEYLG